MSIRLTTINFQYNVFLPILFYEHSVSKFMAEKIPFGKSGFKVSQMGMGTYYDPGWIFSAKLLKRQTNWENKVAAIKAGLESGVNLIDTAELYESENLVKKAVENFEREDLFIATKVWPSHFSYDKVIKSCERSLKKLGVDYVDLYQLHFPSRFRDLSQTMKAMEHLMDQGKIRNIGISNFNLEKTKMAVESLKKYEVASTQMNFSVAHRNIEEDLLPYCRENKIAILAYYPLGHGKLVSPDDRTGKILNEISENHEGKSAPQIALNWFMSKYDFVFPIPRASNADHVVENSGSMGWKMTDGEIQKLEQSFS